MIGVSGAEELLSAIERLSLNKSFETFASFRTVKFFASAPICTSVGGVSGVPAFELGSKILGMVEDEPELELEFEYSDAASES
jgi:hypothetical protein